MDATLCCECSTDVLQNSYSKKFIRGGVLLLVKKKVYVLKFSKNKVHCRDHPRNPVKIFREVSLKKMSRSLLPFVSTKDYKLCSTQVSITFFLPVVSFTHIFHMLSSGGVLKWWKLSQENYCGGVNFNNFSGCRPRNLPKKKFRVVTKSTWKRSKHWLFQKVTPKC